MNRSVLGYGKTGKFSTLQQVVKVIWHKAPSLQKTGGSTAIIFPRWRQCALPWGRIGATWRIRLNMCFLGSTRVHNPNGKSIASAFFAQLTVESLYTLQWEPALSPQNCPFPCSHGKWQFSDGLPSNLWFLGPVRTHNQNGITIGSAVFAQMTAECPYTSQWAAPIPRQNCSFPWGSGPLSYMVPWAHPSPQPKRHIDWFSRFCRAH